MNKSLLSALFTIGVVTLCGSMEAPAQESGTTFERIEEPLAEMEADYAYALFSADSNHVSWIEHHQSKVFVYDLSTGLTNRISLNKGRGPGEYSDLTDLILVDDDLYLSDPTNNKLLKINPTSEEKEDIPFRSRSVYLMSQNNEEIYLLENLKPDVLVSLYDIKNGESISLNEDNLDIQEEFFNPFFKDGVLLSQNDHIYFVEKYRTQIHVFDRQQRGFKEQIIYDEAEVETVPPTETSNGVILTHPPAKVDVLIEDAVMLEAKPQSVFLLARGASDNRDYDITELHEYDIVKKEFVGTHDLGIEAAEITANGKNLFVFSEEDFSVYQYEIHNDS